MDDPTNFLIWILKSLGIGYLDTVAMYDMGTESALGAPVSSWVQAFTTFLLIVLTRRLTVSVLVWVGARILRPLYRRLDHGPERALRAVARSALFYLALYLAYQAIAPYWMFDLSRVHATVAILLFFWLVYLLMEPMTHITSRLNDWLAKELVDWLNKLLRGAIILVVAAAILEIWGVEIGPVLAGLGLFGAALALGAQDLSRSLIGGVLILAEQRFHVGDLIQVDEKLFGWVEAIGFRSTRIRNIQGMPQYIPNALLSDQAVLNIQQSTTRLIEWRIQLDYGTSASRLRAVRDRIEQFIFDDSAYVSPDKTYCEIRVEAFSLSSIDLYIFCYTVTGMWRKFMEERERLAFKVLAILEEEGVSFAVNPYTVHLQGAFSQPEEEATIRSGSHNDSALLGKKDRL